MDPAIPRQIHPELEDLAVQLVKKAHQFSSAMPVPVLNEVGHLVRSMNCYYSNLIEGHDTHPRDIERALNADYSHDPKQRNLQLEAKAHIELQEKIDLQPIAKAITSSEYIMWLHKEFCQHLPIERYCQQEVENGNMHRGSYNLLREAFMSGEFERGQANNITNYKERQARTVLNDLVNKGLLKSDTPKSAVRLAFPIDVVESWFPKLYPADV